MANISASITISPALLHLSKSYRRGILRGLRIVAVLTQGEIKKTTRFIDRTGNLRSSILVGKVNERELSVDVTAQKKYGLWVNDGTTRGLRARKYMEGGLDIASKQFERIFVNIFNKEMGR